MLQNKKNLIHSIIFALVMTLPFYFVVMAFLFYFMGFASLTHIEILGSFLLLNLQVFIFFFAIFSYIFTIRLLSLRYPIIIFFLPLIVVIVEGLFIWSMSTPTPGSQSDYASFAATVASMPVSIIGLIAAVIISLGVFIQDHRNRAQGI